MLKRSCLFFYSQNQLLITYKLSKESIRKGGSIQNIGTIFLKCSEKQGSIVDDARWLLEQPGMDYELELSFHCLKILKNHGQEIYLETLRLYERVTKVFENGRKDLSKLYCQLTLFIVEEEYKVRNITQARFHLRKILVLHRDDLFEINDVVIWTIRLDLVTLLLKRKDCISIKGLVSKEISAFLLFFEKIHNGLFESQNFEILHQQNPPILLSDKKIIYQLFGKKIMNIPLTKEELHFLSFFPHDWLAVQVVLLELGLDGWELFQENSFLSL